MDNQTDRDKLHFEAIRDARIALNKAMREAAKDGLTVSLNNKPLAMIGQSRTPIIEIKISRTVVYD